MTVDTLSLAKELRAAELSSTQAEAIAAAIGRAVLEGTATKADIQLVRSDVQLARNEVVQLRGDIAQVEAKLEARIDARVEGLRATLIMWFVATTLTLAAIVIAVVKL